MSKSDKINSVKWSELFTYDSTTGKLYNKTTRSNRIVAGAEAGGAFAKRCLRFFVQGNQYYVHNAVWVMHNGPIPDGMKVVHISGDKLDNRLENLHLVSDSQYSYTRSRMANNKSGVNGVSRHAATGKWQAHISINGKTKCVGVFRNFSDACEARILAEVAQAMCTSKYKA